MSKQKVSVRGNLAREMIKNVMGTSLGGPIQSGELRKEPKEPQWSCPSGYEYEIIEAEHFQMEYLRPVGVDTGRVVLQLHGGGYIGPIKNVYRTIAVRYSKISFGGDVLTIDYRVAPENPHPAALEDAIYAYEWLVKEKGYDPKKIIVAGDSAGGGLALALGLYLRDHGYQMPAGFLTMSPWTDLTNSGESYETKYELDPLFGGSKDNMLFCSSYIGEHDPREPYISPLFGEFHGFPPVLFQVGSYEVLLSDSIEATKRVRQAGVKARMTVYEGMFHCFQMGMNLIPESRDAWIEAGEFIRIVYGIQRKPSGKVVKRVGVRRKRRSLSSVLWLILKSKISSRVR